MLRHALIGLAMLFAASHASAATLTVDISDQHDQPVANAVVIFTSKAAKAPSAASRLPTKQIIDQRNETFLPFLTLLPRGGSVIFTNNDRTMHQVYSFSPVRQFEYTLRHGEKSPDIRFEKAGVAAIGCNIHDHMLAYVYVTDNGWSGLSGENGEATVASLPEGEYDVEVWHPLMPAGTNLPLTHIVVGKDTTPIALKIDLPAARMSPRMHDY